MPNDCMVNVKVDTTPGEDLIKVLEDMRQEYEFMIKKKHQDLDAWYKEQVKERCPNFPKVPFPLVQCQCLCSLLGLTVSSHGPGGSLGPGSGQSNSSAERPK